MPANIRLATRNDAALWLELLEATVGREYPAKEVYDLTWIAGELSPQADRQTWVAEAGGQFQASITFLKPDDANTNPVLNLGRLLFRPETLTNGVAHALLQKINELAGERSRMVVARVPVGSHEQQQLFERNGYVCAGFQPGKHLAPTRTGMLFYVQSARPVLVTRLPLSESLPQVAQLARLVLEALRLQVPVSVPDGATGYPLQTELKMAEASVDDYSIWRQRTAANHFSPELSTGYNRGLGLLRVENNAPIRALLGQHDTGVVAGLTWRYDEFDRCVRILETFATDDLSLGALLQRALKLAAEQHGAAYVEMDALTSAPRLLKTAEQLGFVPVAYLPAFCGVRDHHADVVKLVKLNVAYSNEPATLTPAAEAVVRITDRLFEDQKVGVAVINLLRTLPIFEGLGDGELRKVARLCTQKLYRPGEQIFARGDAGSEAYIVMRGQVEITLDDAERLLATISAGEVFGEQTFLDGSPRAAAAMPNQPSILLVMQRAGLNELVQREPHLGMVVFRNIAVNLSHKLRRTNATLMAAWK